MLAHPVFAMQIPADFQPLNPSRHSEWATFPLSAQTFIWEQQHEHELAVPRSVWATRYKDDEFRLACLQKSHQCVLKDLQKHCDDGTFEGTGSPSGF